MANGRRPHWFGALIGTPVLVAAVPPVAARASVPDMAAASASADPSTLAAVAALKSQLLSISPAEKLAISGDRVGTDPAQSPAAAQSNRSVGLQYAGITTPTVAGRCVRGASRSSPAMTIHGSLGNGRNSGPGTNHGSLQRTWTPMNRTSPVMNHGSLQRTRTPMNRISPPVMNHGSLQRTRTPMIGTHKP
jgi:hypothetical protein